MLGVFLVHDNSFTRSFTEVAVFYESEREIERIRERERGGSVSLIKRERQKGKEIETM